MIIQALKGIAHIGVFVDAPIFLHQVGIDGFNRLLHKFTGCAQTFTLLAVENIGFGRLRVPIFDKDFFDQILDIFHRRNPVVLIKNA